MSRTPVPRSRRRRYLTALALALCGSAALGTQAMALEFTMFPARDFVEVAGLADGDKVDVDLFRNGLLVGQAHDIAAFEETPGTGFLVLVNHPGRPDKCWEIATPDVVAGDVFRATVTAGPNAGIVDTATVADVQVTQPATDENGDIVVRGFAQSAPGVPVGLDTIEQRLIHAPGDLFDNGTRRLQAPNGPNATLAFDAPGSVNWTARYKSLSNADKAEAIEAESRILHFADLAVPGDPATAHDITIFEFGVPAGPFGPACPPLESGPSIDVAADSDTGASNTDDVTRITTPRITGTRGSFNAQPTANLYDVTSGTPALIGSAPIGADGTFAITPSAPLSEGVHVLRAGHKTTGPNDVLGPQIGVTVDTTAPAAPTISGSNPPPPANDNSPALRGTAETGTTVRLYARPDCLGTPLVTGTAATFLAPGLAIAVADNTTTSVYGAAEDLAGNTSSCGSPFVYQEVTAGAIGSADKLVKASLASRTVRVNSSGVTSVRITCTGPAKITCRGRLALTVTLPARRGKRARTVVVANAAFAVDSGRTSPVTVRLSSAGKNLLKQRGSLTVGIKINPKVGTAVAESSRTSLRLLPAPRKTT